MPFLHIPSKGSRGPDEKPLFWPIDHATLCRNFEQIYRIDPSTVVAAWPMWEGGGIPRDVLGNAVLTAAVGVTWEPLGRGLGIRIANSSTAGLYYTLKSALSTPAVFFRGQTDNTSTSQRKRAFRLYNDAVGTLLLADFFETLQIGAQVSTNTYEYAIQSAGYGTTYYDLFAWTTAASTYGAIGSGGVGVCSDPFQDPDKLIIGNNSSGAPLIGTVDQFLLLASGFSPDQREKILACPYAWLERNPAPVWFDFGGGTTYDATATDGISLSDITSALAAFLATSTDGIATSDTSTGNAIYPVTVTDGTVLSDETSALITIEVAATDGVVLTDAPSVLATFDATAVDGLTVADTIAAAMTWLGVVADGVTLADATAYGATVEALIDDGVVLTDAASVVATWLGTVTDGAALSDTSSVTATLYITAADGATLTDTTAYPADAASPLLTLTAGNRTFHIVAKARTFALSADDKTFSITAKSH